MKKVHSSNSLIITFLRRSNHYVNAVDVYVNRVYVCSFRDTIFESLTVHIVMRIAYRLFNYSFIRIKQ